MWCRCRKNLIHWGTLEHPKRCGKTGRRSKDTLKFAVLNEERSWKEMLSWKRKDVFPLDASAHQSIHVSGPILCRKFFNSNVPLSCRWSGPQTVHSGALSPPTHIFTYSLLSRLNSSARTTCHHQNHFPSLNLRRHPHTPLSKMLCLWLMMAPKMGI